jgi:hypothetical protein
MLLKLLPVSIRIPIDPWPRHGRHLWGRQGIESEPSSFGHVQDFALYVYSLLHCRLR